MWKTLFLLCAFSLLPLASNAAPDAGEDGPPAKPGHSHSGPELTGPDLRGLTTDEIRIYQYGPISTGSLVGGGLLGTFVGLGTGHIVYGEYGAKGWIFTVGELGSVALMTAGLTSGLIDCSLLDTSGCSGGMGLYTFGALAFVGFRIWEIIDVWTLPGRHNAEYEAVRAKVEGPRHYGATWQVVPLFASSQTRGTTYGLGLHATF